MLAKSIVCLALLSAASGLAQNTGFLLGVDYSEWTDPNTRQIASDSAGDLYILSDCYADEEGIQSCVTRLSPDGRTMVWLDQLGFWASAMAVDPMGGVYVSPALNEGPGQPPAVEPVEVVKLDTQSGSGTLWIAPAGFSGYGSVLAVDATGRAWVAATDGSNGYVVRLNAEGTGVELAVQTSECSVPSLLTLDGAGSAFCVSPTGPPYSLVSSIVKIASDGAVSSFAQINGTVNALFVDSTDNVTAFETPGPPNPSTPVTQDQLLRFNASGVLVSTNTFTETIPTNPFKEGGPAGAGNLALLTVDAEGNAYIGGYNAGHVHGVKNTLTGCGSNWLKVVAPDGSILQDTYIPGAENDQQYRYFKLMAPGPGGTFFLVAASDPNNPVERQGPYQAYPGGLFLLHLSQNPQAQTYPLACQANAASYQIAPVSPGEIMALFGTGLGPEVGVQGSATAEKPYPAELAGVQVTFDGNPAPLLWVQDSQINVIAPWSLTPGKMTEICVNNNGVKTNCQTWPVWASSPGVFTVDGFNAIVLTQNPAAANPTLTILATGLGPVTPAPPDGSLIGPSLPVDSLSVSVKYISTSIFPFIVSATVSYAGPVQGLPAGVSEVSFTTIDAGDLTLCTENGCTGFVIE